MSDADPTAPLVVLARRSSAIACSLLLLAIVVRSLNLAHQETPVLVSIAAAALFFGALAAPRIALLTSLALVPLLPISGQLLDGPPIGWEVVAIALLLAALLLRGEPLWAPGGRLRWPLVLSAVAGCVGGAAALAAAVPDWALPGALFDFAANLHALGVHHSAYPLRVALVLAIPLFGYLLGRAVAARSSARRGTGALLVGATLVALYAAVEAACDFRLWPIERYESSTLQQRVISTLSDHNSAGSYLAFALFPALALMRRRPRWGGVCALAIGAAILLTGSRAAWLATILAALAWFISAPRVNRRQLFGVGFGALLLVAGLSLWPGDTAGILRDRWASLLEPHETAKAVAAGRTGFWLAGARMVARHPLCGIGIGRVPGRFWEFKDDAFPIDTENLHNYPLQCVAEAGWIGGALLLAPFLALVPLLFAAFRLRCESGPAPEALALAPGLIAFTISGASGHPWLLPEMQFLFWAAAGLLGGEVAVQRGVLRRPRRAMVVLGWIALAGWSVLQFQGRPQSEIGRTAWGYARRPDVFWNRATGPEWIGPSAFLPIPLGPPAILPIRLPASARDAVHYRIDGGPWTRVPALAPGKRWQEIPIPASGAWRGVELRSDFSFCPDQTGGVDRRIIAAELRGLWPLEEPPAAP